MDLIILSGEGNTLISVVEIRLSGILGKLILPDQPEDVKEWWMVMTIRCGDDNIIII